MSEHDEARAAMPVALAARLIDLAQLRLLGGGEL